MTRHKIFSIRGALVAVGIVAAGSCSGGLGPEDLARLELAQGHNQRAPVGTAVPTPPAARALSDDGRPVPGVVVTFVVTDGGGSLAGAEATSNAEGIAAVTSWTLGQEVGQNVLNATAPGATERVVFIALGEVGPADVVEKLQGDGQSATAGLPVPDVPTVRVTDQFGNAVADIAVTFTVATGGGSVGTETATTAANGEADAESWTLGGAPGTNTLTVTAGEASATFEATGLPGPVALAVAAGDGQTATVGTAVATQPQVLVTDGLGLPVADVPVAFAVTGGGGTIGAESVNTDANGLAGVEWTVGTRTGTNTMTAASEGLGMVSFTAEGTPDVPASLQVASGDNQFGGVGEPLFLAPAVLVQDQFDNPLPGVSVAFGVTGGGGVITGSPAVSDDVGIATAGTWTLGPAEGTNSVESVVSGLTPLVFSATALAEVYDIEIVELARLSGEGPSIANDLDDAARRWEQLVIGDLPDVSFAASPVDSAECGVRHPGFNDVVDDVRIFVQVEEIDGPGNTLGSAGPCFARDSGLLTVVGIMRFDLDDLSRLKADGRLTDLLIHEIGHVLGFGTLWDDLGFLVNPSRPNSPGADTHFNGPRAIAAFDAVGGSSFSGGSKVPVENSQGGAGTRDSHWRESVFGTETMTGFVDDVSPLSVVTVESLGDLGYLVNANAADPYTLPGTAAAARTGVLSESGILLLNDVRRGPIYFVERDGKITRVIHR
jgi:hypothetical protein